VVVNEHEDLMKAKESLTPAIAVDEEWKTLG
jgi:hypothetical protein